MVADVPDVGLGVELLTVKPVGVFSVMVFSVPPVLVIV